MPSSSKASSYENAASRYLSVDGLRIHYRVEGEGPTLVLLHGVMASLHTWDGWVEQLSPHFRIVRFDLPGFGLSSDLPGDLYTPEASARLFDSVRAALGIERFHLAGNSLGGFLSWYYAATHPDRVDRMILISPIAYAQRLPAIVDFVSLPVIGEMARFIAPRFLVERNVRQVFGDQSAVTPALVDRYHGLLSAQGNRRAMVKTFRTLKAYNKDTLIAAKVADVKAPTLLMWGTKDRWVPMTLLAQWKTSLPKAEIKRYTGLGHTAMEEDPVTTAQDARRFLEARPAV